MGHSHTIQEHELRAEEVQLRRLARYLVQGPDSEDLVQDTLVKAMSQEQSPRNLGPWLRQVLRNRIRENARGESRRRAREVQSQVHGEGAPNVEDESFKKELVAALWAKLEEVNEPYRSVLRARFLEGKGSKEIAEGMECAPATIRWRVHEGLRQLREALDKHFNGRNQWLPSLAVLFSIPAIPGGAEAAVVSSEASAASSSSSSDSAHSSTDSLSGKSQSGAPLNLRVLSFLGSVLLIAAAICLYMFWNSQDKELIVGTGDAGAGKAEFIHRKYKHTDGARDSETDEVDVSGVLPDAGTGSVEGQVVDKAGVSVEGAQVCALGFSFELPRSRFRNPPCAETDSDGRYRLEGLHTVSTEYKFVASAPKWAPKIYLDDRGQMNFSAVVLQPDEHRENIDFVLDQGGVLVKGITKDIAGGVVEGARVRSESVTTTSDEEGKFELWLAQGHSEIRADALGYGEFFKRIDVPRASLDIFLTPESIVEGRVVDAQTKATREGMKIFVVPKSWSRLNHRPPDAVSDSEGRFRIDRLNPGGYRLMAQGEGAFGQAEETVRLGFGEAVSDALIEMDPARRLKGYVQTEEGDCLSGSVALYSLSSQRSFESRISAVSRGIVEFQSMPVGDYRVEISCTGYQSPTDAPIVSIADQDADSETIHEWWVNKGLSVRGKVLRTDGADLVGQLHLTAVPTGTFGADANEAKLPSRSGYVASDGTFWIGGLSSSKYSLDLWSPDIGYPRDLAQVDLSDGASLEGVEISLGELGRIEGSLTTTSGSPIAGAKVRAANRLDHDARRTRHVETLDNGRFVIAGLRPGEYQVIAGSGLGNIDRTKNIKWQKVEAGKSTKVDLLVPEQKGEIQGRVVGEDGEPIANACIRLDASRRLLGGSLWGDWSRTPVLSEADGSFHVKGLVDGDYEVAAFRQKGGEARAKNVPTGTTELTLVLEKSGGVSGRVIGPEGQAVQNFTIELVADKRQDSQSETFNSTEGAFKINGVKPGQYLLAATTPQARAEVELKIEEGAQTLGQLLVLRPNIRLRGRLVDIDSKQPVSGYRAQAKALHSASGIPMTQGEGKDISNAAGVFEVEGVPTGEVQLLIRSATNDDEGSEYGLSWRIIDVPLSPKTAAGSMVDIGDVAVIRRRRGRSDPVGDFGFGFRIDGAKRERTARFVVKSISPGGPAEKSSLKVDDEIVSIDGHDIRGAFFWRFYTLMEVKVGRRVAFGLSDGRVVSLVAVAKITEH